jgi:dTDP-4-amino-4,6-dideoxygalactose transaminase
LNDFLKHRRQNAAHYFELLAGVGDLVLPETPANTTHTWNQFTLRTKKREKLVEFLRAQGIGAMVYYPISLHLQKAFASLDYKPGDLPVSEAAQEEVLSLPIYPELSRGEIEDVATAIKKFFAK